MRSRRNAWIGWLAVIALTAHVQLVAGQQESAETPSVVGVRGTQIALPVGLSTVLTTDFDVTRIAVTNPNVADATVVQPREVLIDGKAPGRISLIIWGNEKRLHYEIDVAPPTTSLQQQFQSLFPGEEIRVTATDEAIFLSGRVTTTDIMSRAVNIAQSASPKSRVVNLLQLPQGVSSDQVLLEVRFAEVNRRAITELGVSFFTGPNGVEGNWVGRTTTQQFTAPNFTERIGPPPPSNPTDEGQFSFSDFLNIFLFNTQNNVGALIRALKTNGNFQSLAEPNLVAYNGQEASFLAGGEIPVPIAQGLAGAVTVTYKEFGVRLTFTPLITGDVIRLRVRPEVSALDFANGITLEGFRIPALTTRRAETQVELRDGQSFAIAGLMSNIAQQDVMKVPGLGDVPIIGALFRSKADRAERTELMVIVTPRLIRPLSPSGIREVIPNPSRFLPGEPVPNP
jgi:pilus assembly protein CpaC